ncbi:MAG: hypothetical protein ACLFUC_01000 [Bacteroidales bacterium]
MKKYIFVLAFAFVFTSVFSQKHEYIDALGLRGGLSSGITYKHFIDKTRALEGIITTRWHGFSITGLFEFHDIAFETAHLYWYYGGGAHVGFYDGYKNTPWLNSGESAVLLGVDGIIGIEYNIQEIPVNISLDWKPAINFTGGAGIFPDEIALSIRYTFPK